MAAARPAGRPARWHEGTTGLAAGIVLVALVLAAATVLATLLLTA